MKITYIFDTSVIVYDPFAFEKFPENDIIIPINVLDELDKLKTFPNEVGKNARVFVRTLDELSQKGEIHKGIVLPNKSVLKVDAKNYLTKFGDDDKYVDNKILACADFYKNKTKKKAVLLSRDIGLRVRAKAFEIGSEHYETDNHNNLELFAGHRSIVNQEIGDKLNTKGFLPCDIYDELKDLVPNECVYIEGKNGEGLGLGRKIGNKLVLMENRYPWGLGTKNKEQAMAVDLLLDPKVPLVSLVGSAGTGKTLCVIASALEAVLEQKKYSKLIVYRPIQVVGKDIGYLPGSIKEKLEPYMIPIMDSFEFLMGGKKNDKWKTMLEMYQEKGTIQMEAITYIRGRSIPNAYIILDEAQNISKEEMKTIITRLSHGSKLVITGDIQQIDNNNLDAMNNGLSYVVEKFKNSDLAGHITLTKGERSPLAAKAAEIL